MNLIVIYPFPKDLCINFGNTKPNDRILKWYSAYEPKLVEFKGTWSLIWTEEQIRKYYLEGLLLHEIGHQIDSIYKRFWSKNYRGRRAENFADNFAYYWGKKIRKEFT